ncbi:hypothetical protein GOB93_14090 [Acetobacter musti]|uniref:Helix-turn-helix domain-containing protein n=1 Tax=Acetobacter musti TaxID=864732 RepID=A0ABX0JQM2_9PROT|nr:hypothetical protein [Acetobacter musti]NHN85763.1 hypothetical protein [Acetobacter musti]
MSDAITPRGLPAREAARYIGISESLFRDRVASEIAPFRIGSRCLWDRKQLDLWLDRRSGIISVTADTHKSRSGLDELLGT